MYVTHFTGRGAAVLDVLVLAAVDGVCTYLAFLSHSLHCLLMRQHFLHTASRCAG